MVNIHRTPLLLSRLAARAASVSVPGACSAPSDGPPRAAPTDAGRAALPRRAQRACPFARVNDRKLLAVGSRQRPASARLDGLGDRLSDGAASLLRATSPILQPLLVGLGPQVRSLGTGCGDLFPLHRFDAVGGEVPSQNRADGARGTSELGRQRASRDTVAREPALDERRLRKDNLGRHQPVPGRSKLSQRIEEPLSLREDFAQQRGRLPGRRLELHLHRQLHPGVLAKMFNPGKGCPASRHFLRPLKEAASMPGFP